MNSTLMDIQPYQVRGYTRMYEAAMDLGKVLVTIVWRSLLAVKTCETRVHRAAAVLIVSPRIPHRVLTLIHNQSVFWTKLSVRIDIFKRM